MKNQNKMIGAVIVTRVSTGEQAKHGTSLEDQRQACRAKAASLNLPIIAEYEDGGISGGFLLLREGMQAALEDIRTGRANTLICANISRYSRDAEHQQAILKAVRAASGQVVFCDMDFADTPEGDLAFGLMGQFAQYEKRAIRERTMKGRRRRAEQGSQPMRTSSPYGYHVVTTTDILRGEYPAAQAGHYIVQEEKAALVRDMFSWYDTGRFSLAGIAKHFNTAGVPTPRGGKLWCCTSVRAILINSAYKGQAIFGRIEKRMDESRVGQINPQTGRPIRTPMRQTDAAPENQVVIPCPAIVSEEVWDRVQEKMKANRITKGGNPQRARMLAGRVYCPGCGGTMTFQPEKRNGQGVMVPANYTCFHHAKMKRLTGEFVCDAKTYRQSETEGAVAFALLKATERPDWVQAALAGYHKANKMTKKVVDYRKELQAVDRALEQLKEEQAAAVKGQITGIMQGVPAEAYAEVFADIAARRKDLEDRRGSLSKASRLNKSPEAAKSEATNLQTVLRDVHRVITSPLATPAEKRDLVGRVVDRVVCRKGGGDVIFQPGVFGEVCAETLQADKTVSVGDLSSSIVHPREVYKDAVVASAASIIVAHNHPSGDPTPSAEDVAVTKRLIQSGEIMGIDLLDHIVLGDGTFVSLKERGLI